MKHELEDISFWLTSNKLSLNVSKAKYMIFTRSNVDKLFLLPKRIMRIAERNGYFAHTKPIFKNLNLLELDIYKLKVLKFYFNLIKGNLHSKFDVFCLNHSMEINCYEIRDPKYSIYTPYIIKDKACTHSFQGFVNYIKNI